VCQPWHLRYAFQRYVPLRCLHLYRELEYVHPGGDHHRLPRQQLHLRRGIPGQLRPPEHLHQLPGKHGQQPQPLRVDVVQHIGGPNVRDRGVRSGVQRRLPGLHDDRDRPELRHANSATYRYIHSYEHTYQHRHSYSNQYADEHPDQY
jgi:hypothetical protein